MTGAGPPADPSPPPRSVDPTVRVPRRPVPGRPPRADAEAAPSPVPPGSPDGPTTRIPGRGPRFRQRTIEFGTPVPVKVSVGPRRRGRRRYRTWPYILAVAVALVVLGVVLLVMLAWGATVDGDVGHLGSDGAGRAGAESPAPLGRSPSDAG